MKNAEKNRIFEMHKQGTMLYTEKSSLIERGISPFQLSTNKVTQHYPKNQFLFINLKEFCVRLFRSTSDNRFDTLKYLNNAGSNFIFTDLNNDKVVLLRLDTVTLYNKK